MRYGLVFSVWYFVIQPHIFYAGQAFGSVSFLEIRLTSYKKLFYFPEIKKNPKNIVHWEERKC